MISETEGDCKDVVLLSIVQKLLESVTLLYYFQQEIYAERESVELRELEQLQMKVKKEQDFGNDYRHINLESI